MKRKLFSILTALALCLSLCPAPALALEDPEPQGEQETPQDSQENQGQTVQEAFDGGVPVKRTERSAETGAFSGKAAGRLGTVDLSDANSESGQGYTWTATRDSQSQKITNGTLTLADGFDAETLILPDATVMIVTEGTCSIGRLSPPESAFGGGASAHQMQLTFSGEGTLTIREHVEISGGNDNSLTVEEGTALKVENGISIGDSGVDGLITVDGMLNVTQGTGVSAIYAGKVTVSTTGVLEISGENGVCLNGMDSQRDFHDLFTVNGNGRFTANCSKYTVMVSAASFPVGTTAKSAIPLGKDYLPSDCEARETREGQIDLINTTTGRPYIGEITIHQTHNWNLDDWVNDETGHWHRCRYEGCDKKYEENSLAHSLSWQTSDSEHWQECSVCGYKTTHAVHTPSTEYDSDETGHWYPCEVCEKKTGFAAHTPAGDYLKDASGHWKKCSVCGGDTKHEAHRPKDGYQSDANNHWFTCADCGYETTHTAHSLENRYNENEHWQECVCGYETTHTAHSLEYRHDENNHYQECTACGYKTTDEPHAFGEDYQSDEAGHWKECGVCGKETGHEPHTLSTEYQHDADGHWQVCTACGRETGHEPHVYDGSRDAVCNLCGYRRKIDSGSSGGSGGGGGWIVGSYAVTVEKSEHGKVASSRTSAANGSTVTLTVTPDGGYALDTLTVTDRQGTEIRLTAQGGGKYAFTMPARDVTVKAAFAPLPDDAQAPCDGGAGCPSRGFADLEAGMWYHEAVDFVLQNGLMGGYGNGMFGPDDALTRAQLVQILYNQAGRPAVTAGSGFSDVAPGAWCAGAVAWAAERGIAGGYGDGRFGPNDPISREQLAVLLWRYAGSPAASGKGELPFSDAGQAGGYALEALRWAVESGVMSGRSGGVLAPKGLATRAQAAQMLKNYEER